RSPQQQGFAAGQHGDHHADDGKGAQPDGITYRYGPAEPGRDRLAGTVGTGRVWPWPMPDTNQPISTVRALYSSNCGLCSRPMGVRPATRSRITPPPTAGSDASTKAPNTLK